MLEKLSRLRLGRAVVGPGILVMLADADAGNVVAAADAGAHWGYRLLPLLFLAAPALYLFQDLTIRLAIATGEGFVESVARVFGRGWARLLVGILFLSSIGNLVTQFSGIAGVGDMWSAPRLLLLCGVAVGVVLLISTNTYRRIERVALVIAVFELAFFLAAWKAGPSLGEILQQITDQPLANPHYQFSAAALIGAIFNPWMIFYQQSAVAERRLTQADFRSECVETGLGAVLAQALTAAMLICGVAVGARAVPLASIGGIANALTPLFGDGAGRIVFSLGVSGAALTSIIVSSLTVAWALGEAVGRRHPSATRRRTFAPFMIAQGAAIVFAAVLVSGNADLIWLNTASQALGALLLPLVLTFLFALARKTLPAKLFPHPTLWFAATGGAVAVSIVGVFGGVTSLGN